MRAATLNDRLSLQQAGEVQDGLGQPIPGWPEITKLWAEIRYLSGMQAVRADAGVSVEKVSIRIRTRAGIVPSMRLVDAAGVVYSVESVLPNKQRRTHIDLVCTTGANRG